MSESDAEYLKRRLRETGAIIDKLVATNAAVVVLDAVSVADVLRAIADGKDESTYANDDVFVARQQRLREDMMCRGVTTVVLSQRMTQ